MTVLVSRVRASPLDTGLLEYHVRVRSARRVGRALYRRVDRRRVWHGRHSERRIPGGRCVHTGAPVDLDLLCRRFLVPVRACGMSTIVRLSQLSVNITRVIDLDNRFYCVKTAYRYTYDTGEFYTPS